MALYAAVAIAAGAKQSNCIGRAPNHIRVSCASSLKDEIKALRLRPDQIQDFAIEYVAWRQ